MAVHEIRIDRSKTLLEEPVTGHNRWHPEIEPLVRCDAGDEVVLETRDAFDGQMGPQATLETVAAPNLDVVHPLTGPVYVEGAAPGDLLEVEILDCEWGEGAPEARIAEALKADREQRIRGVMVVHNETATGVTSETGTLPGYGEAVIGVPVTVSVLRMVRQVVGMLDGQPVDRISYEMSGKLEGGPFGTERFRSSGEFKLPEEGSASPLTD